MTEFPSSLPGIDVASGLPRVAGNKKLYLKLLRHVANDAPNTREKITNAIMEGDLGTIRELAHSLKGSSANLSITDVAAAAEQLESSAKADDMAGVVVNMDALEKALDDYVGVVATLEGLE